MKNNNRFAAYCFLAAALLLLPSSVSARNVWHFNADSCRVHALSQNAAVANADLEVMAAEETKKAAFTKYFPSIQASVAAFRMSDYLIDVHSSDIKDGGISLDVNFAGEDISVYFDALVERLGDIFASFGIDLRAELDKLMSDLSYDASFQLVRQGVMGTVTATQPVYAGGRIVAGNKLAGIGVEAAKVKKSLTEKDVAHNAEQRYWLLVSLNEKMKTLDKATQLLDALYKDVSAAYEASLVTRNDLLKVSLKRNELISSRSTLESGIALANMALCQYIGLPPEDMVVAEDSLASMTSLPVLPPSPDSADVTQRAEYRLLQFAADAEKYKKRMVVGEYLPQLAVGAGYAYSNLWGTSVNNAGVFVSLTVPITAWWEGSHNIRKQKIQEQIAINNRNDYSGLLALQIRQTWNELSDLYRQVFIFEETIEQAEENVRVSGNYYDAGMISLSEYLEAQSLYQQSLDQYVDKCIEYKLKHLEYNNMLY